MSFHWAILGPGNIAHQFAQDLARIPDAKLVAVGSRNLERARAFADQYGADHAAGSYAGTFDGPRIDAVYIATRHVSHRELTLLCLERGIAVLCEKPLGMNLVEVEEMITAARHHGTYLMEALWSRFLPHTRAALELIDNGEIGEVESLRADFGFRGPDDPASRLWDPALGGGALLDIGIYPVWLAQVVFGPPEAIAATARLTERGVDAELEVTLTHAGGRLAHCHATLLGRTKTEALIHGTTASLHLHSRFHEPSAFSILTGKNDPPQNHYFPNEANGYRYEAEAVMADVRAGKTENEWWSLDDSLALHRTLTEVRRLVGVVYPGELGGLGR